MAPKIKPSKPIKSSNAHNHSSNHLAQRPIKETTVIKKPTKTKATVSAAGIFKKKSGRDTKKHRRRRTPTPEPTPEPELLTDLRDGLAEARSAIDTKLKTTFTNVREGFLQQLAESRSKDIAFFESVSATASMLSTPLAEEQIETIFRRDGKRVTEIVNIGKKVAQFKRSIEKEEVKLKDYWKQWEDLQNEFIELGAEVFGAEAFGMQLEKARGGGYKEEMELLDLEHNAMVDELGEEIEDMRENTVQRMKVSERELETSEKQQQARILQAIIHD